MNAYSGPNMVSDGLVFAIDAGNQKSFSPNVFQESLDIYSWYVTNRGNNNGNNCTVSQDATIGRSPAGGIPLLMSVTGSDSYIISYSGSAWNLCPALSGQSWTMSIYAKANVPTTGQLFIFSANSSGTIITETGRSTAISITTEWKRFEWTRTFADAATAYIQVRLDGSDTAGQSIWWDGLQVELSSAATDFNPNANTDRTTIKNLIMSTNNGSLINYPGFSGIADGTLVFNGTDQYITSSFATTSGQAVTYCGWLYSTETTSNYKNFFDTVTARPMIWWNTSGQIEFDAGYFSTPSVYRDQWVYVCLSKPAGSSSASYYVNGDLVGTGTAYTVPTATPTWFNRAAGQTWKGYCSSIQAYNRALSAQEIQKNFAASRRRFGL